jgi:endonuclease YncB( thermonuclease family)
MTRFRTIRGGRRFRRLRPRELRLGALAFVIIFALGLLAQNRLDTATAFTSTSPAPPQDRIALRVIDGDTMEVRGSGERLRLANIDTPEIGDGARCTAERRAAAEATRAARQLISQAERLEIRRTGREDQYGRTIGFVILDGRDLGQQLIAGGHARPWRGRREPWCGSDGNLIR